MGVSGCGKSTIGALLAEMLAMNFYDADDFHSENCIRKMENGIPLDEEDRKPWLLSLAMLIAKWNSDKGAVLACSALKAQHRKILSWDGKEDVVFIHLDGHKDIILERMSARKDHFFPPGLLESQFSALEAPFDAITVQIDKAPEDICVEIINNLESMKLLKLKVERDQHV
jgi:carbohydrate kinase (thermoresistant glucokinase family)